MKAAILCARERSEYFDLEGLDVYDRNRDAFSYSGPYPVVAHPPCRMFGRLAGFSKPVDPWAEYLLGVHCMAAVRKFGGVLEHPRDSKLWPMTGAPRPNGPVDRFGGYTINLPQSWFGHRAEKLTWLYVCRVPKRQLPELPFALLAATKDIEHQGEREREATPRAFAEWLISVACAVQPGQC